MSWEDVLKSEATAMSMRIREAEGMVLEEIEKEGGALGMKNLLELSYFKDDPKFLKDEVLPQMKKDGKIFMHKDGDIYTHKPIKKYSVPSMMLVDFMRYTQDLAKYSSSLSKNTLEKGMDNMTEEKLERLGEFAKKVLDEIELLKRSGLK
tara:strand:+ start:37 stop:486 length:450 start_codon:yes stop_codon:yes gene_type:complete